MTFHGLSIETGRLANVLHFDPMSFCFSEEGEPPTFSPKGVVALSLDFLQELLLRKKHRVLYVLMLSNVKHVVSDDPRLVNVDDVNIVVLLLI